MLEPIYVFDHMVIPSGAQILGRVTQVENASGKRRALAIANGNFSPIRKAHIELPRLRLALQLEGQLLDLFLKPVKLTSNSAPAAAFAVGGVFGSHSLGPRSALRIDQN